MTTPIGRGFLSVNKQSFDFVLNSATALPLNFSEYLAILFLHRHPSFLFYRGDNYSDIGGLELGSFLSSGQLFIQATKSRGEIGRLSRNP